MKFIWVFLLIFLALMIVAIVANASRGKRWNLGSAANPTFRSHKPLTQAESVLYHRLVAALPECIVLAQVQLTALMTVSGIGSTSWFNKISRKSVDFVVCLKDFTVVAAIELDDRTHDTAERRAKDADKNAAFEKAGVKLLRMRGPNLPTAEAIRDLFTSPSPPFNP